MTWMFSKALMNSLCSQESAAESLPVSNSESEPSVQLSVMPTQHKFWHNDKMMDHSNLSRFGLTLQLLTESRGEELLTLYRADFPVRTLVSQEKAQGSKAKGADSGQRWSELLAKYDPVSFLWKTSQLSLLEDLELSLETWPKWGMTRSGVAYQRQKLEPITSESAFGFYVPTPTASDGTSGSVIGKDDTYYKTSTGMPRKITRHGVDGSVGLGRLVNMWPTPDASMNRGTQTNWKPTRPSGAHASYTLNQAVRDSFYPTPKTSDANGACMKLTKNGIPHDVERGNLRGVVKNKKNWSTPTTNDAKNPGGKCHQKSLQTEIHGSLSSDWVEWLMGFPVGWSDLKAIPGVALSWAKEPEGLPRVCEKQEYRALRLKGIGNAQVPQCAAAAFVQLLERINE